MDARLLDLYSKAVDIPFTEEEIEYIKQKIPSNRFRIKYGFWKKSIKGLHLFYAIDYMPEQIRKSGVDHSMKVISTRLPNEIEYDEIIANFGACNRKYRIYFYKTIEEIIKEDKKYKIETPLEFIQEAINQKYTDETNDQRTSQSF